VTGKINATRAKLLSAAADSLRGDGLARLSARVVAARAGVNQALIFYHFGSVAELVQAASRETVDASAAFYHDKFAAVTSFNELLALGRELHERERARGNVAMMAQLMSGAQWDETLAGAARYAMQRWNEEIEVVVRRVMEGNPLADFCDPAGLARAVSAGFLGLELYEGVDKEGAEAALEALERLGDLVAVMDDLGPIARQAVRAKARSAAPGSTG
jgi:AcrR family transcriptional regulator